MLELKFVPKTVGELKAALTSLPDDMPVHQKGGAGNFVPGISAFITELAAHKNDSAYFADVVNDPLWSKPNEKKGFKKPFKALCFW